MTDYDGIKVGIGDWKEFDLDLDTFTACVLLEAKGYEYGRNFTIDNALYLLDSLEKEAA